MFGTKTISRPKPEASHGLLNFNTLFRRFLGGVGWGVEQKKNVISSFTVFMLHSELVARCWICCPPLGFSRNNSSPISAGKVNNDSAGNFCTCPVDVVWRWVLPPWSCDRTHVHTQLGKAWNRFSQAWISWGVESSLQTLFLFLACKYCMHSTIRMIIHLS